MNKYIINVSFVVLFEDDKKAKDLAENFAKKQNKIYDNQCRVESVLKQVDTFKTKKI